MHTSTVCLLCHLSSFFGFFFEFINTTINRTLNQLFISFVNIISHFCINYSLFKFLFLQVQNIDVTPFLHSNFNKSTFQCGIYRLNQIFLTMWRVWRYFWSKAYSYVCHLSQWINYPLNIFWYYHFLRKCIGAGTDTRYGLDELLACRRDLYLISHNIHNRHLCPRWDSNPQSQQTSGCRPTP